MKRLRTKTPSIKQAVVTLSGGNQQKVVLAKWLAMAPKVLILDEPTRGIDVGAKAEIYRHMADLAEQGITILMVSSDMEETIGMSDRVVVAGDMLSDVEMPLLDLRSGSRDPLGDYEIGLGRIAASLNSANVTVIPGHGSIARGDQANARVLADQDYLEDLRSGRTTADPRLGPAATYGPDWLPREHELQRQAVRP